MHPDAPIARRALAEAWPGAPATLTLLHARQSALFVAQVGGQARRFVAKVVPDSNAARATLAAQARAQRRLFRGMAGDAQARVPQVLHLSRDGRVLIMPFLQGQTLAALWQQDDALPATEAAGRWCGACHALSAAARALAAAPEIAWLDKAAAAASPRAQGDIATLLGPVRDELRAANGMAMAGAMTHRDLNPGNLIVAPSGMVWGVDMENSRMDYALRDPLFLLSHAIQLRGVGQGGVLAQAIGAGWRARLGASHPGGAQDPQAAHAFQRHQALAGLARLPEVLSPGQVRRRAALLWIAGADQALFA